MSLFPEQYELYNVFVPVNSDSTKKVTYPVSANFQIRLNVIRIDFTDAMIEAEQLGEYRANAEGANAASIVESAVIENVTSGLKYIVVNKPRYNKLFVRYKLNLKPANF